MGNLRLSVQETNTGLGTWETTDIRLYRPTDEANHYNEISDLISVS
jgi:hypothetical protein